MINSEMRKATDETKDGSHALYKVMYYDKRKEKFIDDEDGEITKGVAQLKLELLQLLELKDNDAESTDKNLAIDKIVYHIISELRYFIKSSDYSFEKELRIIQLASSGDDKVKIDEVGNPEFPRLYIESKNPILSYLRSITLGPKVSHPEQRIYLEARIRKNGGKITLRPSNVKFQ